MAFVGAFALPSHGNVRAALGSRSATHVTRGRFALIGRNRVRQPLRAWRRQTIGMVVGEGDATPVFKDAPVTGGGALSSDDIAAFTILAFYPRDGTSGCTCEVNDFTRLLPEIEALGAKVIGVSPDSLESHDSFIAKESIGFPLLSDESGEVITAFSVWKDHPTFGKVVDRSSFIIKDGKIVKEFRSVKSQGHADNVVAALKAL